MKDKRRGGVGKVLRPLSCFNKEPSEHSADSDGDQKFTGLRDECTAPQAAARLGCVPLRRADKRPEEAVAGGWRFLLNSELPARVCSPTVPVCIEPDPSGRTEQRTFTLSRSGTGFGFTLVGSQPVRVGKVDPESTAGQAGVRSGDIVVGINGENVLSCNCDRVVHIIRQCQCQLDIRIQRWLDCCCCLRYSPPSSSFSCCSMLIALCSLLYAHGAAAAA